jgi:hypothetical protein
MKRFAAVLAVLAIVAAFGAVAGEKQAGKEISLTGYLTDSDCGAKNANTKGKSCALDCIKKGAKVQLYSGEKLYTLDKVDALESKLGMQVKVTGVLDETTSTIKVTTVEAVKQG